MTGWMRLHVRLGAALLCLCLLGLTPAGAGARPGTGRGGPQRYYLALGDSLAFGFQQAKFKALQGSGEPASAFDTGYVDDLAAALRMHYPRLAVVNDGCPGETTDSFIAGPCEYQLAYQLHHQYSGGPTSSQLSDALSLLNAHRNFVNPVTIDIGANDALHLLGACNEELSCVAEHAPALMQHLAANLALILGDLRAAAPRAKIAVLGLYDPFAAQVPALDQPTAQLNEVIARAAAEAGALFVNPMPEFNPPGEGEAAAVCSLTNFCSEGDVHATDLGYAVLGGLLYDKIASTPPFGPPLFGRHG